MPTVGRRKSLWIFKETEYFPYSQVLVAFALPVLCHAYLHVYELLSYSAYNISSISQVELSNPELIQLDLDRLYYIN
jgi:hypothetical protein